jgi:hypothetical protein
MARHASKIAGPKRQQFMLTPSGLGSESSVCWSGFSRILSEQAFGIDHANRKLPQPIAGKAAGRGQRFPIEQGHAWAVELAQSADGRDRIIVIGIDRQKIVAAGKSFGRSHGIGRATRLGLHGEVDRQPPRLELLAIVLAHQIVFRTDNQANLADAGVGHGRKYIIQERPADRDHRLEGPLRQSPPGFRPVPRLRRPSAFACPIHGPVRRLCPSAVSPIVFSGPIGTMAVKCCIPDIYRVPVSLLEKYSSVGWAVDGHFSPLWPNIRAFCAHVFR